MKIKDLRKIEVIDPFLLGDDNRKNAYIEKAIKITGLDKNFFEFLKEISMLQKEEFLEKLNNKAYFFNGRDDTKIIALRFVAIMRGQSTKVFKNPLIIRENNVNNMELKDIMDYGFGSNHFWFLNAINWDESNVLYYNDTANTFLIKNIFDIL